MSEEESFDKRYNGDSNEWKVYPEFAGYDFILVNAAGVQIGVQAKLRLSLEVIEQILPYQSEKDLPDHLAILVPRSQVSKRAKMVQKLFWKLGLILLNESGVIPSKGRRMNRLRKNTKRLELPSHVGNLMPGGKCPRALSKWKIGAIKLHYLAMKNPTITFKQFREHGQTPDFWIDKGWAERVDRGIYRHVFGKGPVYEYATEGVDLIKELNPFIIMVNDSK